MHWLLNIQNIPKPITPALIVLLYVAIAAVWLATSDFLLALSVTDTLFYQRIGLASTLIFLAVTSYLIYRVLKSRQASQQLLNEQATSTLKSQRLANLYAALSCCNQAIVRSTSEEELFPKICHSAVEFGGMDMAWIGMVNPETQLVKPVAWFGDKTGYLQNITISTDANTPLGRGPTGRAIRNGQPSWCQDFMHDPFNQPWHEAAKRAGWASTAALPLHRNGVVIGAFTLYSRELNAFDETERNLLLKMSADIDYAMNNFANEAARKQADQALRKSQEYLRAIIENEPECVKTMDAEGTLLDMNRAGLAMLEAHSVSEVNQRGLIHFVHPKYRDELLALHKRVLQGEAGRLEFEIIGLKGTQRWLETNATPLRDSLGAITTILSITRDVTERKHAEAQIRLAGRVFEQSREGFVITDANKNIILINQSLTKITGYTVQELQGKNVAHVLNAGLHDKNFYPIIWESVSAYGYWQGEILNRRKNGEMYPKLLNISTVIDESGAVSNYVCIFSDLSQLKASEQRLEFLAHHDPLTRLPNRLLLLSRLQHGISLAQREQKQLALMMLDLDRFKNINDSFGHLTGDELLQQVAERLTATLRKTDTVARLGGDEFTILLEDIKEPEDAARIAKAIIADLNETFQLQQIGEIRIGASIGISLFPQHGDNPEMLLQQADSALYLAKSQGRGRYAYFSEDLTIAARKRMELEARLRRAITQDELCVYYQPQVDIATGRITGAEALVRWLDPVEGMILPACFISVAEESGLIIAIGEWMLREVCNQGKRWLDEGLPPLTLALNVSSHQFIQTDIDTLVAAVLAETGFPGHCLELELTESALMDREEDSIKILNNLRAQGIRLAIDDFGTGYSSLAYLKHFPLDVLKIDKSFIDDIPNNKDDMEIATTILAIGDALGLKVLAEGVETDEQLTFLTEQGCDLYQGYLKSEAIPAAEFAKLLREHPMHDKHLL